MRTVSLILILSFLLIGYCFAQDKGSHKGSHSQDMSGNEDAISEDIFEVSPSVGICPVMGGAKKDKYSYAYKGKAYYFCCPGCIKVFKENPEKYIAKVKKIKIEAYQFGYSPEKIVVKKGDIVSIIAISRDVAHGFFIKEYGINVTVKSGEPKKIEFIADKKGEFPILCSIYCGRGHHGMRAKLIVEE